MNWQFWGLLVRYRRTPFIWELPTVFLMAKQGYVLGRETAGNCHHRHISGAPRAAWLPSVGAELGFLAEVVPAGLLCRKVTLFSPLNIWCSWAGRQPTLPEWSPAPPPWGQSVCVHCWNSSAQIYLFSPIYLNLFIQSSINKSSLFISVWTNGYCIYSSGYTSAHLHCSTLPAWRSEAEAFSWFLGPLVIPLALWVNIFIFYRVMWFSIVRIYHNIFNTLLI